MKSIGDDMATFTKLKRKRGEAYLIRYVHPRTKKFVRKVVWCTKTEAEMIVKKIMSDIALGKFLIEADDAIQYTISQLELQFRKHSNKNKSIKTVQRQDYGIKTFCNFLKHDLYLTEINTQLIENYRDARLQFGSSPTTVAIELKILKTMFNYGIKSSMVDTNPVNGVIVQNQRKGNIRFLKKDEVELLLKTISEDDNHKFYRLVIAYLNTGARRIELLPPLFAWKNIDFNDRKILLPGIKKGDERWLPMNSTLHDILIEIKNSGTDYPFEFKPVFVSQKIKHYYRKAGITGANLHSLRKTFGSTLLQDGVDIFMVSKLLGHNSVQTTQKYYVDYLDENYRSTVNRLDK